MNQEYLRQRLNETKIQRLKSSNKLSYGQMARNVGSSIVKNVVNVAKGNELKISAEEAQKRLDICKSCQFFDKTSQRCSKCGCYLAVKTYLKAEHCPINKW